MLKIWVAPGCGPSAEILASLLQARNVPVQPWGFGDMRAVTKCLHWGGGGCVSAPSLNSAPRVSKLEELRRFAAAGVPHPVVKDALTDADFAEHPLWYARKTSHRGGTDLRAVTQADEAAWRLAAGWAFFTARVPIRRELRTWVFRGRHLGTYEKKMVRPAEYTGLGRNNRYGFAFSRLRDGCETSAAATEVADDALTSLGLDFGAVDLVQRPDGKIIALEVNTAPGIENERRVSANRLADAVAEWYRQ